MSEEREVQGGGRAAAGEGGPMSIEAEMRTTASADAVWHAWTTPEGLASWFVDRATGRFEAGSEVVWHWDRFGFEARQIVRDVQPGERLLLEGETPQGARFTEITIRSEAGTTVLRVVESGFHEDDGAAAGVASGWRMALEMLRHVLETGPTGLRQQVLCLRPAAPSRRPTTWPYRTVADLSTWLGEPVEGSSAVLRLEPAGAGSFTGRLLLDTGTECLWYWEELRALVEMKAFSTGTGWMAGLAVSAWGDAGERLAQLEPALHAAVGRLVALPATGEPALPASPAETA